MTGTSSLGTRRGFTQIELVALVVVGGLLTALLITLGESRRQARLGEDMAKLRQIGAWTGHYAADNQDAYWTYSWKKGQSLSQWPDLNNATSDLQAAANQAVDILRRVAGQLDIQPIVAWIPHVLYSHLPLEDYLKTGMPDLTFVSAADKFLYECARDPEFCQSCQMVPPPPGCGTNAGKRVPFGASFGISTAFYDGSDAANRISQGSQHNQYFVPNGSLAGKPVSSVAFPSQKVHAHDGAARHFGPRVSHCAFPEMRLPLLFADGSVRVHASADANPGWHPNQPTAGTTTSYSYTPGVWEPPTPSGLPSELVTAGRYRWTRGFLDGRDFGGPEACTGQPGCP